MFKKILVPLDGSELAEEALPVAVELAEKFDGELILVTILLNMPKSARDFSLTERDDEFKSIHDEAHVNSEAYLNRQLDEIPIPNDKITMLVRDATSPADGILDLSDECAADAIVMSTHGRSGLNRWVFGSVAEKVLRGAHVPVVLIRSGES